MNDKPTNDWSGKPENVTEEVAEVYLRMKGWTRLDPPGMGPRYINESLGFGVGSSKSRGEAVVDQYRRDYAGLLFILGHTPKRMLVDAFMPVIASALQILWKELKVEVMGNLEHLMGKDWVEKYKQTEMTGHEWAPGTLVSKMIGEVALLGQRLGLAELERREEIERR